MKKLALVAICFAYLSGTAMAQDAKTVIASAKKALGDPTSVTYSGSAKDVAFQQCGANATQMNCQGTHNPMRPIANYVRVIDLNTSATRQTGGTNNIGPGGSTTTAPGTFFAQVTTHVGIDAPYAGATLAAAAEAPGVSPGARATRPAWWAAVCVRVTRRREAARATGA